MVNIKIPTRKQMYGFLKKIDSELKLKEKGIDDIRLIGKFRPEKYDSLKIDLAMTLHILVYDKVNVKVSIDMDKVMKISEYELFCRIGELLKEKGHWVSLKDGDYVHVIGGVK